MMGGTIVLGTAAVIVTGGTALLGVGVAYLGAVGTGVAVGAAGAAVSGVAVVSSFIPFAQITNV